MGEKMKKRLVFTQEELEKAIEERFYPVLCGDGYFEISDISQVTARDNSRVTALDSSRVTALGNSQVTARDNSRVTALGNSRVRALCSSRVTALDSSQVTALDSSQVRALCSSRVTALDSSQVTALDSSQVTASKYVAVTVDPAHCGKVTGGVQIKPPPIKTADEWCDFYGVPVKRGVAILFKAVDDDYSTENARNAEIFYKPGEQPFAKDWDGGEEECGGGLHFSPTPYHALGFSSDAKHFIACPIKASEIVVHFPARYPAKVKAPRLCKPCYEVDIDGNPI